MRTVREIADHRPLLVKLRLIKRGVIVLHPGLNHRVTERAYEVEKPSWLIPVKGPAVEIRPHAGHLHTAQQVACDHGVTFDQVAAAPMTVAEVRAKYPRLDGPCPKGCGFHGIAYVSTAHFVYGDW